MTLGLMTFYVVLLLLQLPVQHRWPKKPSQVKSRGLPPLLSRNTTSGRRREEGRVAFLFGGSPPHGGGKKRDGKGGNLKRGCSSFPFSNRAY